MDVLLPHVVEFLAVVEPVEDLLIQLVASSVLEQASLIVVDDELASGGLVAAGDDGDAAAGDGLNGGDGLNLGVGAVDVDVGLVQQLHELGAGVEAEVSGNLQVGGEGLVLVLERAGAGEDELDLVLEVGALDGLDEDVLALLMGVAADHGDDELVLPLGGSLHLLGDEVLVDAVGNDVELGLVMMAAEFVGDELGGAVDELELVVVAELEPLEDALGNEGEVVELQVVGDVLGLDVEGAGDGDLHLPGDVGALGAEAVGDHEVDEVAALEGSSEDVLVGVAVAQGVLAGALLDGVVDLGDDELVLLLDAGSDDDDGMAVLSEDLDGSSGGDGDSVSDVVPLVDD